LINPPHGPTKGPGDFSIQTINKMKTPFANTIIASALKTVPLLRRPAVKAVNVIHEGKIQFYCETWSRAYHVLCGLPDPILPDGSLDYMVNYFQMGDCVTIHVSPRSHGTPHSRVEKLARVMIEHNQSQMLLFPDSETSVAA
jgi:hypothetical protein